jgi:hypothetical protein
VVLEEHPIGIHDEVVKTRRPRSVDQGVEVSL